ncbi:MAG: hypothetical protein ACOYIG_09795 [Acetivibrionales bacterium]
MSLLIAMGVMGVLFAVYVILSILLTSNIAQLNKVKKEAETVEAQIAENNDLLTMSNNVNILLKDATLAAGENPEWGKLITAIGNSVPESISLSNIKMEFDNQSGFCTIDGVGLTHNSVSEWIQRLEEVTGIDEIRCSLSALSDKLKDNSPVVFEVGFTVVPGKGYQLPMGVTDNE